MKNKKVMGAFLLTAVRFTPDLSHAIRLSGTSEDQYVDIANVNRARTQKIRRVRGKVWWAKRRRS